MIDYQIDDTQLRHKSRFSSHLKWHSSRNFSGSTPAHMKDAEQIPDPSDTPWYTEQHYILPKQVQGKRPNLIFAEDT